jgi:phage/plasmid-associated DNA primase
MDRNQNARNRNKSVSSDSSDGELSEEELVDNAIRPEPEVVVGGPKLIEELNLKILPYDLNERQRLAARLKYPFTKPNISDPHIANIEKNEELATFFFELIDKERAKTEWSNLMVGKALFTVFGSKEGFRKWIVFSETNKTKHCIFRRFALANYRTCKTLALFAQEDNPERFCDWQSDWYADAFRTVVEEGGNKLSMGSLLARFAFLTHVTNTKGKTKTYHNYANHGWNEEVFPNSLTCLLVTKVKQYLKECGEFLFMPKQLGGGKELKAYADLVDLVIIKKKIGDFHHLITSQAADLLYDATFITKKSSNTSQIRMNNCVIETTLTNIYVRSGTPEDFVSMSTNIDYRFDMTMDCQEVMDRERWMYETFGSQSLADAMSFDMASFAKGCNIEKLFRSYIGLGNNSKSMHIECLGIAFGDFMKRIPTSALSGKSGGQGSHTAEIARTEGAFLVVASEPEANEYIHGGRVKGYTAGVDKLYIRNLYEDGREIMIVWKLILMTNHNIPIGQGGKALDDRVMVAPFESRWSTNAPPSLEVQEKNRHFKLDKHFANKLTDMAQAYWFLTVNKYYAMYVLRGTGPKIHETILNRTIGYNRNNNLVLSFWDECTRVVRKDNQEFDLNCKLICRDAYQAFKDYFRMREFKVSQMLDLDAFATTFYTEASDHGVPTTNFTQDITKKEYGGIQLIAEVAFGNAKK